MLFLFYKFIKESFFLFDYIFTYYLSNVVVITSLQILFILFLHTFFIKLKEKIKERSHNNINNNNINAFKKLLTSYHEEQIKFINKVLSDETIKNLFFKDNITSFAYSPSEEVTKTANIQKTYPSLPESPVCKQDTDINE